ncbi:MAG: alpha/beta fold hydrolase [Alphaproteobacteria bacterium]
MEQSHALKEEQANLKGRTAAVTEVKPLRVKQQAAAQEAWEPDPAGYTALFSVLDRTLHANMARYTLGLSPRAIWSAYLDWVSGVASSPGKQAQLLHKAQRKWMRYLSYAQACLADPDGSRVDCIEPLPQDHRFRDEAWRRPPFNLVYQGFLLSQQWWHNATTGVSGVTPQNERAIEFAARQALDMFSPSNFVLTNPVVLDATLRSGGQNLVEGAKHVAEDMAATIAGTKPPGAEAFVVGQTVAVTPGKIVYRNRLIELIQYEPTTSEVYAEPILITPAWIMKYYILDLSPKNSLVKYLVERGHTVFIISWKNPDAEDRDLGFEDYLRLGPLSALEVIGRIVPEQRIHAVGYCLGGTLLAILAAALARDGDKRLASLTFLAAQVDFSEAGELMLFINEKQIAFLEDLMWEQGFLDSAQMAGAFQMLRSNDLIWSRLVQDYLLGERKPMTDLMAWNADGTRMPYRMHAEYLKQLFLHNDFSEGRYKVDGRPVRMSDVDMPMFVVATERDHVAPWRSVFKFHGLTNADLTFLLVSGGHNVGIVSPPGDAHGSYRLAKRGHGEGPVDPDLWLARTRVQPGSWWIGRTEWLVGHSSGLRPPPAMGHPDIGPMVKAPGDYVRLR